MKFIRGSHMRVFSYISVFLAGMAAFYLTGWATKAFVQSQGGETAFGVFLSFLSVMLTAVTVVLAAVAIGIGVVAAYTFPEIRKVAKAEAEKTAEKTAKGILSDVRLKELIQEASANLLKEKENLQEWGTSDSEDFDR